MERINQIFPRRDYYAHPENLPQLDGTGELVLSPDQVEKVVEFEHRLYDLQLDAQELPSTAAYLQAQRAAGTPVKPLEETWRLRLNSCRLGIEYFNTDIGRQHFEEATGIEIEPGTPFDIARQLASADIVDELSSKTTDKLQAKSVAHEEVRLAKAFLNSSCDGRDVENTAVLTYTKNPENLVAKAQGYRDLKNTLKLATKDVVANTADADIASAKLFVVKIYQQRVNSLISELYSNAYQLVLQNRLAGDDRLRPVLDELSQYLPGLKPHLDDTAISKFMQTIDRYQNGIVEDASGGTTTFGWLSNSAVSLLSKPETAQIETTQRGRFEEVTVDELTTIEADGHVFAGWMRIFLGSRGILSSQTDYDSERTGTAFDDKWQVHVDAKHQSLSVNQKQKVVKVPETSRPVIDQVALAQHEGMHVLQGQNREVVLPFKICNEIGVNNTSVQTEAGALDYEAAAREKLTGQAYSNINGTGYMAALACKANGGNYGECMKAFFDDFRAKNPTVSDKVAAQRAANRTGRVFRRGGVEFAQGNTFLTNTQPLHYLEQAGFSQSLKGEQRTVLLISGIGLHALAEAHRLGLTNLRTMLKPEPHVIDVIEEQVVAYIKQKRVSGADTATVAHQ